MKGYVVKGIVQRVFVADLFGQSARLLKQFQAELITSKVVV